MEILFLASVRNGRITTPAQKMAELEKVA